MKTTNKKLHTILESLDRNLNLEYINAIAEQLDDNLEHLQSVSNKADGLSDLNMFKYEFDRLNNRSEVLLNMIFKLLDESKALQDKSFSLIFEMLKESAEK